MTKYTEFGKTVLKADSGMSMHKDDIYTPKVYLFDPSEENEWEEVVAPTPEEPDVTPEEIAEELEAML